MFRINSTTTVSSRTDCIFELPANGRLLRDLLLWLNKNDCRSAEQISIHRAKLLVIRNFIESPPPPPPPPRQIRIDEFLKNESIVNELPCTDSTMALNKKGIGTMTRHVNVSSWKDCFRAELYKQDSSKLRLLRKTRVEEITAELCCSIVDEVPLRFKYWNNLEMPDDYDSLLRASVNEISNISSENNKECGELTGMNTPMYYLATANSYCEMHLEDSDLESINVVKYNIIDDDAAAAEDEDNGDNDREATTTMTTAATSVSKLWLIVPKKNELLMALAKYAKKGKCPYFIFHKNTYVTTKFLIEHKIEFHFALQFPGDLIVVKRSVFHQVINITPNFCESMNYGSASWNLIGDAIFTCFCPENKYTVVRTNPEAVVLTKTKKITLIECETCSRSFTNKTLYANHMKKEHNVAKPLKCERCDKCFASMSGIRLHYCVFAEKKETRNNENDAVTATAAVVATTSRPTFPAAAAAAAAPAPKRYRCRVCDTKVIHKWNHAKLASHKKKVISANIQPDAAAAAAGTSVVDIIWENLTIEDAAHSIRKCVTCNKTFGDYRKFQEHTLKCALMQFTCNYCDRKYSRKDILAKHIQTKHVK